MKTLGPSQLVVCLIWCLLGLTAFADDTNSKPIQFCKQDDALSLDFCVAVMPYQNATSASTDLYVTITRTRSTSNGWLAVGLGSAMNGALMFVLYDDHGNPNLAMKTNVRTASGHHQPIDLSAMDFAEGQPTPDIRVIKSAYDDQAPESPAAPGTAPTPRTGTANIVIYSANLWLKATIDPKSRSQPWIWAHNPTSQHSSADGTIQLNPHTPSQGVGYGFFWTDLASAISTTPSPDIPPRFPTPNPSTTSHLSTDVAPPIYRLGGPTIRNWLFHIHGTLTSLSFLLLYPLGAILLRTSDSRAFNFHWTTQAFASVLLCLGAGVGFMLSRRIELVHQVLGLGILGGVGVQVLLGWRHHVAFLGRKAGTWMRRVHVWVGRGLMGVGWVNVLLGLWARGYGWLTLMAASLAIAVEAGVVVRVLVLRRKGVPGLWSARKGLGGREEGRREAGPRPGAGEVGLGLGEEYFELVGHDDEEAEEEEEEEDTNYDEDGRLKADVEWEERMRRGEGDNGGGRTGGEIENAAAADKARKLNKLDIV